MMHVMGELQIHLAVKDSNSSRGQGTLKHWQFHASQYSSPEAHMRPQMRRQEYPDQYVSVH